MAPRDHALLLAAGLINSYRASAPGQSLLGVATITHYLRENQLDYFQGVVTEYLRANRSVFVNTECLIQLDEGDRQIKGRHWYCDAMAVNFKESKVYLCETTYSATMQSLLSRLQAWQSNWSELARAVLRDAGAPSDWNVQPWVFIPKGHHDGFARSWDRSSGPRMKNCRCQHRESLS